MSPSVGPLRQPPLRRHVTSPIQRQREDLPQQKPPAPGALCPDPPGARPGDARLAGLGRHERGVGRVALPSRCRNNNFFFHDDVVLRQAPRPRGDQRRYCRIVRPRRGRALGLGPRALKGHAAVDIQYNNAVRPSKVVRAVRHEDDGRISQNAPVAQQRVEAPLPRRRVQRGQRVVQQTQLGRRVDAARQGQARLLPAAQRDAALADLRGVAGRQLRDVLVELRGRQGPLVAPRVEALGRERGDVPAHRGVQHARPLRRQRDARPIIADRRAVQRGRVAQDAVDQRRLAAPDGAHDATQFARPQREVQAARTRDEGAFSITERAALDDQRLTRENVVVALRLLVIVLVTHPDELLDAVEALDGLRELPQQRPELVDGEAQSPDQRQHRERVRRRQVIIRRRRHVRREERDRRDDGRRDHEEHRQAIDEHLHAHVVQFYGPQRAPARAPERLPAVVLGHADASEHLADLADALVRHRHPPFADRDHPPS
mmetsp:Transcript_3992/g.11322  ORF Transcript_3992/g.11322 Transcript_3992/m.11322 type:complete len:488 (-) Transcript_3992:913-2376(-)